MNIKFNSSEGKVFLVGAGPGDPDLLTVKGARLLEKADVVVYDRLANTELLEYVADDTERIYVGKKPGKPSVSQVQINQILVNSARDGFLVVRLKGGDPFVFGRGGEECEALKAANVPFEIVPGISSALASPAYAGIPLTHRGQGRSFTVVTGHTLKGSDTFENWANFIHADTLVVLMGMRNLGAISRKLIQWGKPADTPAAVIERASWNNQKTVIGTLRNIEKKASDLGPPATIVIGELVEMSQDLSWFAPHTHNQKSNVHPELYAVPKFAG